MRDRTIEYAMIIIMILLLVSIYFIPNIRLETAIKEQQKLSQLIIESDEIYIGVILEANKKVDFIFKDDYWEYTIYNAKDNYTLNIYGEMPRFKVGDKVIVFYNSEKDKYSDPILYEGE